MNSGKQQNKERFVGTDPVEGKDFGKLLIFKYIICSVLYIVLLTKSLKNLKKIPFDIKKLKSFVF